MIYILLLLGFLTLGVNHSLAQQPAIFNNGAAISVSTGAVIGVTGNFVSRVSDIQISTAATLRVTGDVVVSSGTLTASSSGLIDVNGNLTISNTTAAVVRTAGGQLSVLNLLTNAGQLHNSGLILIGN